MEIRAMRNEGDVENGKYEGSVTWKCFLRCLTLDYELLKLEYLLIVGVLDTSFSYHETACEGGVSWRDKIQITVDGSLFCLGQRGRAVQNRRSACAAWFVESIFFSTAIS